MMSLYLGALGASPVALGVAIAGLVGHGISGPIVHLAHGHPLLALGSFGLEAGLPALTVGLALGTRCSDLCDTNVLVLVVGTPIALSIGTAIDSAALAWEDRPKAREGALAPAVRIAPLVLPPLRTGSLRLPSPAGAALVGRF
jgi:hypothetical protein